MFWGMYEFVLLMNGLDEDAWLQLWAGVFGAVPAAVISAAVAAAVAVTVLNRSNEHQRILAAEAALKQQELADSAAKEQRERADRREQEQRAQSLNALAEQRSLAERQLSEQRSIAEQRLAEQRSEAKRVREQNVCAEVVIAVEDFVIVAQEDPAAVRRQFIVFKAAVGRWRVELGPGPMQSELMNWPHIFLRAATTIAQPVGRVRVVDRTEAYNILREAVSVLSTLALNWPTADPELRKLLKSVSEDKRPKLEERIGALSAGGSEASR